MAANQIVIQELSDLEQDVGWRRDEIAYLRKQECLTRFDPPGTRGAHLNQIYLRLLISSLYAHHEGYAIRCWDAVYNTIDRLKVEPANLIPELQLLVVEVELKHLRHASAPELLEVCSGRQDLLPSSYCFSASRPVQSDGNLKPKPFTACYGKLGINVGLDSNEEALLFQLVERRNDVVHGRQLPKIIADKIDSFTSMVYELQDRSFLSVTHYLESGGFRNAGAQASTPSGK